MTLLLALACALADLNDCRVTGELHCEAYRPQGLVCGFAHADIDGHPGADCLGVDPSAAVELAGDAPPCPDGYRRQLVQDHEADGAWHMCVADGNADRSSADLGEVPRGAACGFGTAGAGAAEASCLTAFPSQGECPDGFTLRYTLDVYADRPDGSSSVALGGHLLTWCELTEAGCDAAECGAEFVCGLHGTGLLRAPEAAWFATVVDWEELSPGLTSVLEADLADGEIEPPSCPGSDEEACPDGLVETCTGDWVGSTGVIDHAALCWCTGPDQVRPGSR